MGINSELFQFPGIDNVYCLFLGIPDVAIANNRAWGSPEESQKLRAELLTEYQACGLAAVASCYQVHGVRVVPEPDDMSGASASEHADGMCTEENGKGLLIKTADCQPILFTDRAGTHIMAIHAGWRGNRANFPGQAVKFFTRHYNLEPKDIFAVRGPSLCPRCAEFVNFEEEWGADFKTWFDEDNRCMDLWSLTEAQLQAAGVPAGQIYGIDLCTLENPHKFYSYRKNKNCGRQASLVWRHK